MFKVLAFVFVLYVLPHQISGSNDVEWYRNEMKDKVVPLYSSAYQILKENIIDRILQYGKNTDHTIELRKRSIDYDQEIEFEVEHMNTEPSRTTTVPEQSNNFIFLIKNETVNLDGEDVNEETVTTTATSEQFDDNMFNTNDETVNVDTGDVKEETVTTTTTSEQPDDNISSIDDEMVNLDVGDIDDETTTATTEIVQYDDNMVNTNDETVHIDTGDVKEETVTTTTTSEQPDYDIITNTESFDVIEDIAQETANDETTVNSVEQINSISRNDIEMTTIDYSNLIDHSTTETSVVQIDEIDEEQKQLEVLVKEIDASARTVHDHLQNASTIGEQLRARLAERVENVLTDISEQEIQINRLQSEIEGLTIAIQDAEQQIAFAQQVVSDRERDVANAERELRDAEDRVEKARKCQRKRRKRLIGGWVRKHIERPIVNVVKEIHRPVVHVVKEIERPIVHVVEEGLIKPICSVVNMDGINRAKDARNSAGNSLNDARNRLSNQQQILNDKRTLLSNRRVQHNVANVQQQLRRATLVQYQANLKTISSLLGQFQAVNTHLSTVLGSSKTLMDEIKNLVDFELVIEPLNSLSRQMINEQLMTSFSFHISASTIADVDKILDRVSSKLARLPIFVRSNIVSDDIQI